MNLLEGLRHDYLEYLRLRGIEDPGDKPTPSAIAAQLTEIARVHPDKVFRRSVAEHLEAAATLEKIGAGKIDDTPARLPVGTGSGDLARYVDTVLAGLTQGDAAALRGLPIYFGLIPRGSFNAMVVPSQHGRLCLLDTGLSTLLFGLSKAVSVLLERSPAGIVGVPQVESARFGERVTLAYSSAAASALGYLAQAAEPRTRTILYKPVYSSTICYEPWQLIVANALTFAMKSFVMAHEIGHAVLGHVGETTAGYGQADSVLESPHDQEFAADRFAFETLLRSEGVLRPKYPVTVGAICFLTCYLFLLRMQTRITGVLQNPDAPSESHPAPLERIRRLVALAVNEQESIHPAFFGMAALFRKLLEADAWMNIHFNDDGSFVASSTRKSEPESENQSSESGERAEKA